MLELNKIYNCDCLEGLRQLDDNSIDMTVTSPPYDNLRSYLNKETGDECVWNFEVFKPIAQELYRVTRKGGVVVWVVGDACIDNGETGSSFRQALYFQELGFKIHDTMIYEKNSSSFPAKLTSKRYSQIFEYMFVFSKGKIRGDLKLIADKRNKWAGWTNWGEHSQYDADGNLVKTQNIKPIAEFSLRTNIWKYPVSFNDKTGHPAVFPEKLAEDHILSWSNEGETVLDPFMGSGTTAKMAMMNHRNYIGFEVNTGYYEASLNRIEKYVGKFNDKVDSVSTEELTNIDKEEIDSDNIQLNPVDDKDLEKKAELWKELTSELSDYFNTQSLGILKNLKVNLTFASKANDKRVEKVLQERGVLPQTENTVTIKSVALKADTPDSNGRVYPAEILQKMIEESNLPKAPYCELSHQQMKELKIYSNGKSFTNEQKEEIRKIVNEEIDKRIAELSKKPENCQYQQLELFPNEPTLTGGDGIGETLPAKETAQIEAAVTTEKRKRGRPKGSKNKPKETAAIEGHKLRATWPLELAQDVPAFRNIDAEVELSEQIAENNTAISTEDNEATI